MSKPRRNTIPSPRDRHNLLLGYAQMTDYCEYCDPKKIIVYGFCSKCKRRCDPPLYEPKSTMSLLDYEAYKKRWNESS